MERPLALRCLNPYTSPSESSTPEPHLPILESIPGPTLNSPGRRRCRLSAGQVAHDLRHITPQMKTAASSLPRGNSHSLQFLVLGEGSSRDGFDGVLFQASEKQSTEQSVSHPPVKRWWLRALRAGQSLSAHGAHYWLQDARQTLCESQRLAFCWRESPPQGLTALGKIRREDFSSRILALAYYRPSLKTEVFFKKAVAPEC